LNLQLLLTETEQSIEVLETTETNETQTTPFSGFLFGLERFLPLQMADAAKPGEIDDLKISLGKAKLKLEELKADVVELKTQTPDEQTIRVLKEQLKDTVEEIKLIIKNLEKAKLSAQATKLESAENIGKVKSAEKQIGKWSDDDSELETDVYDSKGNKVNLIVSYEKLREGKFSVKISPDLDTKPGMYKIVSTYTVDGVEHKVASEFAFGLVSLNTAKSIYKPAETAEFVIVVLDSEGHPIDGAELEMIIVNPNGKRSTLETGDEIVSGSEIGLYETEFRATGVEGTYSVFIHATAPGIDVPFETTFDVRESYEYDIIRTAQSKIDPTTNPNAFDVVIDIESFTDANTITITETIPSVLEVETDATVITVGDRKVLTWTKDLVNEKTSVSYTYSVPFVFPSLYDLGPLEITNGNVIFTEARAWYVANDPVSPGASISAAEATTINFSVPTDDPNDAFVLGVVLYEDAGNDALVASATLSEPNGGGTTCGTLSGTTFSNIASSTANGATFMRTEVWGLSPVPSHTDTACDLDIVITNGVKTEFLGMWTFTGVDTSSAFTAKDANITTGTTASTASIASTSDDYLIAVVGESTGNTITVSGADSVIDWQATNNAGKGSDDSSGAGASALGDGTNLQFNFANGGNSADWAWSVVEVNAGGDTTAPIFTVTTPTSSSTIDDVTTPSSDITWSVDEALASGSITITRTAGAADASSPHTCTFVGTALNSGAKNNFQLDDTTNSCSSAVTLQEDSVYTFAWNGQDAASNTAIEVSRTSVLFNAITANTQSLTESASISDTLAATATAVGTANTQSLTESNL